MSCFRCLTICSLILLLGAAWLSVAEGDSEGRSVDFLRDVQPLLTKHCVSCHSAAKREGGLRLDLPSGLRRVGVSGDSVISGSLQSNELFLRVTSRDEQTRMPLGKPGLNPSEVETLRSWIQQGCPLPKEDFSDGTSSSKSGLSAGSIQWLLRWFQEKSYRIQFALVLTSLVLLGLLAFYARIKQKRKGALPLVERTLARLTWEKSLLLILVTGLAAVIVRSVDTEYELHEEAKLLESKVFSLREQAVESSGRSLEVQSGGYQFKPFRYQHPNSIARTYYRGNCERDPKLFNGGNYLTAKLKLSLRRADGVELKYGDVLPQEGVVVHFAIERAPGTAEMFYEDKKMGSIFLSGPEPGKQTRKNIYLEATRPNWIWEADFPIDSSGDAMRKLSGIISVYRGNPAQENSSDGERHYSLNYDLEVVDGKIDEKSDLWCGCVFAVGKIQPPPTEGMIPLNEWFDWRPIPEIEGENTKDPVLLGLPTDDQSNTSSAATPRVQGDVPDQEKP